ncbi:acyl carrier protein [Burkholderia contaminans]|uniref:acyl carrier protein n=1 Tax=Burkholderia contaminans TaxID=488447 RepID=UPI00158E0E90|nr:acyl carrier protein [Burkholderia contaminans]
MSNDTRETVRTFLQGLTNWPFIDAEENLFERGLLTSLTAMAVVDWIETTFGFAVEGDDLTQANLGSIHAIAAYIDARLTGAAAVAAGGSACATNAA